MKPTVFIASSVEGKVIADEIQLRLRHDADCEVWDQGIFDLSTTTLESLLQALDRWNFGIFVFSSDDVVQLRSRTYSAIRDNVIFELGLLVGRLGREKAFIVRTELIANDMSLRIPTDLQGVTVATFDSDHAKNNLSAALGPASTQIARQIRKEFVPRAGLYLGDEFTIPIGSFWHSYIASSGSISFARDSVHLLGLSDAGFEFPHGFEVPTTFKFILFRVRRTLPHLPLIMYIAIRDRAELFHIALTTKLKRFGWGATLNEFEVPLANPPADAWHPVVLETSGFNSLFNKVGPSATFKFRAPVEVSHIWCAEKLEQIPEALRTGIMGLVSPISIPNDLPVIEILTPEDNSETELHCEVTGVIAAPNLNVAVYVFSEDRKWYRQGGPIKRGHSWSPTCVLGTAETGRGWDFKVVSVASKEPVESWEPRSDLPDGARSSTVTLKRANTQPRK